MPFGGSFGTQPQGAPQEIGSGATFPGEKSRDGVQKEEIPPHVERISQQWNLSL